MDNILIELEKKDILSRSCERALLIGFREKSHHSDEDYIDELKGLVASLGIPVIASIVLTLRGIHHKWLLGSGKVEEIGQMIRDKEIDLVVFDMDLSPAQQRNLEKYWNVAVIDRPEVILDIFADRASTREAVLQVALARMQYSLPRLTRAWTHLSRQRGGARGNRGKGETQLESDRRIVLDKIAHLKRDLVKVKEQRDVRRQSRLKRPIPSVSLVGYTNSGKSSLLNALSGADVYVKNQLFATLDPTTRRIKQPGGREFLLSDTVGFVRKLPHDLINAFRSTLEEAILADVILVVADAGDGRLQEHIAVTESVLNELGAQEKQRILVLNKVDRLSEENIEALSHLYPQGLLISARKGIGLANLVDRLGKALDENRMAVRIKIPPDRWDIRSRLHQEATVLSENFSDEGLIMNVRLSTIEKNRFSAFLVQN